MYDTVLAALRRSDADAALAAAQELVELQPDDPAARRLQAHALRLAGDHSGALAAIDAALALAPEDADLHLERAGLLLHVRDLDRAQAALARSVGLDPNQFPAYIIQAQLALGRGELDEAERLVRTAARIAPEHPQLAAVEGTLALRRGRPDQALALLSRASDAAPQEPMLRHALGFAYLAQGHLAFAEQAFRGVLQAQPDHVALKALIADLVRRQGRPGPAAAELAPLLDDPAASPALHRLVGELEVEAGQVDAALPRLKHALAMLPGDRRTLSVLLRAWQQRDDRDDARSTLDAALATHPHVPDLWLARLGVETFAGDEARAVIDRWTTAMPDHVPALVARITALDAAGDRDGAETAAQRVVELEPGHTQAEMRLLDGLMQREPDAAAARLRELAERAPDADVRRGLQQLLGFALDQAGRADEAVATWTALQADAADQRLPLPPVTGHAGPWPETAPVAEDAPGVLLLWGAPGSMVERIARTLELAGGPMRSDRLGPQPPNDPLQRWDTAPRLVAGELDPAYMVAQWRAALASRGVEDGNVFDWLLHWDNALLLALRPHLPEAVLMFAVRDPRDMLLDWLAFGSPVPLRMESPRIAAQWLARVLDQVADAYEQALFSLKIIRLDEIGDDPRALTQALADSLRAEIAIPPAQALGPARLPAGHWRRFEGPLAEAFAELAPVAARLGYTD
ncbi:tetratricopeptide repeat protein [Lysobacter humi (ex Lee et al. 2017)]